MWDAFVQTFFITLGIFVLLELVLRFTIRDKIQDQDLEMVQAIEDSVVLCRVDKIDDVFYLYNSQNEQFIGQGKTVEDFWDIGEKMQKFLMVVDGDKQAIELLNDMQKNLSAKEAQ